MSVWSLSYGTALIHMMAVCGTPAHKETRSAYTPDAEVTSYYTREFPPAIEIPDKYSVFMPAGLALPETSLSLVLGSYALASTVAIQAARSTTRLE